MIHGHDRKGAESPTHISWRAMRQRCGNSRHRAYKDYGGRGIRVAERWNSFANFLADMGERPAAHTLDRENTNGNYEPGNCKWSECVEQLKNRRPYTRKQRAPKAEAPGSQVPGASVALD